MFLFLLILLSSLCGFAGMWIATGGLHAPGGNPIASVLVGIAIALAWGRGMESLERAYLAGRFDAVRRKLSLWGAAMGVGETLLVRIWLDVESRRMAEVEAGIEAARRIDLDKFARAWSAGVTARLDNSPEKALACFLTGAQVTDGLDRAELYCEAALVLLQVGASHRPTGPTVDDVRTAIDLANRADDLVRTSALGVGGKARLQYLMALQRGLRGLIYLAQGRYAEADDRLRSVIDKARMLSSLRARRLAQALRLERLLVVRETQGREVFQSQFVALQSSVVLPGLRLRMMELEALDQARHRQASAAERPEALRDSRSSASPSPAAEASDHDASLFTPDDTDDVIRPSDLPALDGHPSLASEPGPPHPPAATADVDADGQLRMRFPSSAD